MPFYLRQRAKKYALNFVYSTEQRITVPQRNTEGVARAKQKANKWK